MKIEFQNNNMNSFKDCFIDSLTNKNFITDKNKDNIFKKIKDVRISSQKIDFNVLAICKNNEVILDEFFLKNSNNQNLIYETIFHELFHIISKNNKRKGFYYFQDNKIFYQGLNEGVTDLLALYLNGGIERVYDYLKNGRYGYVYEVKIIKKIMTYLDNDIKRLFDFYIENKSDEYLLDFVKNFSYNKKIEYEFIKKILEKLKTDNFIKKYYKNNFWEFNLNKQIKSFLLENDSMKFYIKYKNIKKLF